jgi:carbonic anhydrase
LKPTKRLGILLLATATAMSFATNAAAAAADFSYSGDNGPGFWAEKAPACAATPSAKQSPINIRNVIETRRLEPLDVLAQATSFTLSNPGYTVVATPRAPAILTLNGTTSELLQFHFHTSSEHAIDGRQGVMELHAVFQDRTSHLTVIGVMFRLGRENRFLSQILQSGLPQRTSSPEVKVHDLNLADAFTDLASYYTYDGSLTTPPCFENVTWFVLQQFAEVSRAQLQSFHDVLGNDFRPVQKLNDRVVLATRRR